MIEQNNLQPEQSRRLDAEASDPWLHRSAGMLCKTCIWYLPKASIVMLQSGQTRIGRCRRHAPTMVGYPVVYMTDWCGDHRLDENKL
jgi:Pyruvate/2-oxoacid:ferredoxin oxidoreductase delta subunit